MRKNLKYLSLALLVAGGALLTLGLAAKSDATPVGQMDCGCGGGTECVTKNAAVSQGSVFAVSGSILLLLGGLSGTVAIVRRSKAAA